MKAMIFAAGLGTRLKPITDSIPKALLPIGGKTLLEWQLLKLKAAGITDVVINIHHFPEQIVAFCREHDFGLNISFSDESEMLLETGGGLKKAHSLLGDDEPVLVMNVDVLSNIDIRAVIAAHQPDSLATIVVSERETQRYFLFDEGLRLRGWTNIKTGEVRLGGTKPDEVRPASLTTHLSPLTTNRLAFSGMHIVSPAIFKAMAPYPDKFSITDFYIEQCAAHTIRAYVPTDYRMMDIGKIDHLDEAEAFAASLTTENDTLCSRVKVEKHPVNASKRRHEVRGTPA